MGKLITRWTGSTTWEEWDVPINPNGAKGTCYMKEGTYGLHAVAQNYYLEAGDVVSTGSPIVRGNGTVASVIYSDEVRTGGTVAWICRNPGNIRDGDKFGAFKGKKLQVNGVGTYAIFPDETHGPDGGDRGAARVWSRHTQSGDAEVCAEQGRHDWIIRSHARGGDEGSTFFLPAHFQR